MESMVRNRRLRIEDKAGRLTEHEEKGEGRSA